MSPLRVVELEVLAGSAERAGGGAVTLGAGGDPHPRKNVRSDVRTGPRFIGKVSLT